MPDFVDDLMTLWQRLPADDDEALTAFATVYAERVTVNGVVLGLDDFLARARSLQGALTGLRHEVLERVEAGDKLVVAFVLHGQHTGPLSTPLGEVLATGKDVHVRAMDVLTLADGRITDITVLADDLGLLMALDAVTMR